MSKLNLKALPLILAIALATVLSAAGITKLFHQEFWTLNFLSLRIPSRLTLPVGILETILATGLLFRGTRLYFLYFTYAWLLFAILLPLYAHLWSQAGFSMVLGLIINTLFLTVRSNQKFALTN